MTVFEFRCLDETGQLDHLYAEGVYLGKRRTPGFVCVLYQLDTFYVEIIYLQYRLRVHRLRVFESVEWLDPYLEKMSLTTLWNEFKL